MEKSFLKSALIAAVVVTFSSCGPGAVVVRTRPVAPVVIRPSAPRPDYIWVDGDWIWRGNQYVYKQGYWAAPQRRYARWVPGHWRTGRGGSHWVPGHWK